MINGIVGKHYGKIVKKLYRILLIKLCALYGAAASAVQIKPAVIVGKAIYEGRITINDLVEYAR